MTIPKVAVLATGLGVALLAATINPAPVAQAYPSYAATCTGCHAAGGSVSATPSSANPAPGAAFSVDIAVTGGSGNSGYWISGNGVSLTGSPGTSSFAVPMTAPAAAGTYTYTVWVRQGVASSKTFSIIVAPVVTTPPPTTVPPTTVPPTTVPPTTVPPTTVPPTTVPPTTPPVGYPIQVDEDSLTPTSALGTGHLSMYNGFGATCGNCHDGASLAAPPSITGEDLDMERGVSCRTCHSARGEEDALFISLMNDATKVVYNRCSDCHTVVSGRDGDDGDDRGDWGDDDRGDWGDRDGWDD